MNPTNFNFLLHFYFSLALPPRLPPLPSLLPPPSSLLSISSLVLALAFLGRSVGTDDHGVVSLVGFQSKLLKRLEVLSLELANLPSEDRLRCRGRVNAARLNRDNRVAPSLQKVVGVQRDDTRLVGLRNVGKDDVDHANEHPVLEGVPGILNDWNYVGAGLGHVDEVAPGTVGELYSVDTAGGTDNVGNVGDGCSGCSSKV